MNSRSLWAAMLAVWFFFPTRVDAQSPPLVQCERLVQATYKLANPNSTAACIAIETDAGDDQSSKRYLLSADHVLRTMTGNECTLVSRKRRDDGSFEREEISVAIRKSNQDLWKRHPQEDLALLPISDGVKIEALPASCLATRKQFQQVHVGDGVRLAVFPERNEANDLGFPLLRGGSIASFPVLPHHGSVVFRVDTNAWTGDSGGPVIWLPAGQSVGGTPMVIGIVRSMINVTDTVNESRFVQRRTDYPLGISEVVASVAVEELLKQFKETPQGD